ncbi:MAG: hypothetical protein AABX52_00625 [Nanoarchaeota archaeon]
MKTPQAPRPPKHYKKHNDRLHHEVELLYEKLLLRKPEHFSYKDMVNVLFAASLFSVLIFNQLLLQLALSLSLQHIIFIVLITTVLLTLEIYYLSYTHIDQRSNRLFGQFWAKRFFTIYGITLCVTTLLIYLYNLDAVAGSLQNVIKIAIATSFPSSIAAGATALAQRF